MLTWLQWKDILIKLPIFSSMINIKPVRTRVANPSSSPALLCPDTTFLRAVAKLAERCGMYSLGCSAPSKWRSHKSFISLGCMGVEAASHNWLWNGKTHPHTLVAKHFGADNSTVILTDFTPNAMNKTCIDMHIKRQSWQSKTETNKDVGAAERGEERAFPWTCFESLTQPISRGLAPRPSGDAPPSPPPLHLDIIAPPEEEQVSAPRDACSRLARHALQFHGLRLSSH